MGRSKVDFWVGLFVLLGGGALVFLALQAGNLGSFSWAPTYTVTAEFDNIGGLKPRAAVKSAGVVVGRVESVALDGNNYMARVTMRLQDNYRFPSDSSASILTAGLLGEQYVGIDPGSEDADLTTGDRIRYTQGAIVLESLISRLLFSAAEDGGRSEPHDTGAEGGAP